MIFKTERLLRWIKEPLVHFLLIGAALFLLFHFVNKNQGTADETITITSGMINKLASNFERVWNRPPTEEERQRLIDDYIKEEIYYREAVAMGLDREDPLIRRRLKEKLEVMQEGMVDPQEPSDAELQKFLNDNPEKFRIEPRYTLNQIFLNRENPLISDPQQTEKLLLQLNKEGGSADAVRYGDSFPFSYYFSNTTESNLVKVFGQEFADKIARLPQGSWTGPVPSKHGFHIVFVHERQPGSIPAFSEIRGDVYREWLLEKQKRQAETYYGELKSRYKIVIEESAKPSAKEAAK